jgi:alkanesulfonate monooxygenase SsuD/methylene tetrahydromethanopterin reductase-like flavin-dependent oxidoreductase (luciferase family)
MQIGIDSDELFTEKLELLLKIRASTQVWWSGKHRAPLTGQPVYPRPVQNPLPVWIGVGGTPNSFARAGALGLPLAVAIIGGEPRRFRPLVELYREAGRRAGHSPEQLTVGVHMLGFVADTTEEAANIFFPPYVQVFNHIGRERGWSPITRAHFDAMREPAGAMVIGDPETVAEKMRSVDEALGGVSRITLQLTVGTLPHTHVMRAIELLGTRVVTALEQKSANGVAAGAALS